MFCERFYFSSSQKMTINSVSDLVNQTSLIINQTLKPLSSQNLWFLSFYIMTKKFINNFSPLKRLSHLLGKMFKLCRAKAFDAKASLRFLNMHLICPSCNIPTQFWSAAFQITHVKTPRWENKGCIYLKWWFHPSIFAAPRKTRDSSREINGQAPTAAKTSFATFEKQFKY